MSLIEEIAVKSAGLPLSLQEEVLNIVNRMLENRPTEQARKSAESGKTPPFFSVKGILNRKLATFEEDLAEVRREMWQNFPRDEPKWVGQALRRSCLTHCYFFDSRTY